MLQLSKQTTINLLDLLIAELENLNRMWDDIEKWSSANLKPIGEYTDGK